jgi:hypothetical protein
MCEFIMSGIIICELIMCGFILLKFLRLINLFHISNLYLRKDFSRQEPFSPPSLFEKIDFPQMPPLFFFTLSLFDGIDFPQALLFLFPLSLFEGIVFPSLGPSLGPPSTVLVASREKPPFKHAQLVPESFRNFVKWDLSAFLRRFDALSEVAVYD